MKKYIDTERLKAEIERLKEKFSEDFIFSRDEEGAKRERLIESEIHARIKCVLCDTFIELVTSLQQEQPEVNLEKEYTEFVVSDPVYSKLVNGVVGKSIARHFYELGLNARKEE